MLPVKDSSPKHVVCSLPLNGAAAEGWMDEESREQGKGRPQSKLVARRERSFGAQVGYDSAFMSGWLSCADGIK